MHPKPPCRVKVMNGDQSKDLGEGEYIDDVSVYFIVMPDQSLRSRHNAEEYPAKEEVPPGAVVVHAPGCPKIKLDSGDVVYGCQVWWGPV